MTGVQTCALQIRSEEHTSELQSHDNIGCRPLLEKEEAREDVVGFFVKTLVLATDPGVTPTFAQLLPRLRETDLGAYFFFNDTAATEIYTLSLHDALPI